MKIVKGNLITLAVHGEFDVIIHGCNCQGVQSAGIAKSIKQRFPMAYAADRRTPLGKPEKLGTYSSAEALVTGRKLTIVNAYTQFNYKGKHNADYEAIRACFKLAAVDFAGKRIGYPKIGAGLAGGDWEIISKIIDEELEGMDHTLVEFECKPLTR